MSFKENLKAKIRIDRLARKINCSFKVVDGISRVDREAVRALLALSPYRHRRERDLDLYIHTRAPDPDRILVLDNDLPLYQTSAADVVLRKSPTLKEMISFRNVRRILSDGDVVISKKQDSVAAIQRACIHPLDLDFQVSDIDAIARDGKMALEGADAAGVLESLSLFAELLGYTPAPAKIQPEGQLIFGILANHQGIDTAFGPLVVYSRFENTLKYIEDSFDIIEEEDIDTFRRTMRKTDDGNVSGPEAFRQLAAAVIRTGPRFRTHGGSANPSKAMPENGIK